MRIVGYFLLVAGFLWISYDVAFAFTDDQAVIRTQYSKTKLPEGDTVRRSDAVHVMFQLSLALKDRHRIIILPAIMMFVGGFFLGSPRFLRL